MTYLDVFKMPKPKNVSGRTSSITNSFVNGIIPCIQPTEEEVKRILTILGMDKDTIRCAYCGKETTEWDHFRPLVKDKRPTGYISEINNLVPACGKCNQSKRNIDWKTWMLSDAPLSPKTKKVADLEEKIKRLEEYEKQTTPIILDFESLVGKSLWEKHWQNYNELYAKMKESMDISNQIKTILKNKVNEPDFFSSIK